MRINIHKFGLIENASIDFAKLLVFTGDSNLGKSYVNYLMYYFIRSTSIDELEPFISSKIKSKDSIVIPADSLQSWLQGRVEPFMRGFLNAPDIECNVSFELFPESPEKSYSITYSEQQIDKSKMPDGVLNNDVSIRISIDDVSWNTVFPKVDNAKALSLAIAFSQKLQRDLFGQVINYSLILPPARGAFVGENYSLKSSIASSVGMYQMFLGDYDRSTIPALVNRKRNGRYQKQIENLVNGKLVSKDGKQYLVLVNGKELPLSAAASSIKELSPLLFALQANPTFRQSFCIEEPEAHLHPKLQVSVVDLLANCYKDGHLFQFTTHSDYVLQRINQLIKLNYLRENDKDRFKIVCDKYGLSERHCISEKDIKIYYFHSTERGVEINNLQVTNRGIPMVAFFEVVEQMSKIEDDVTTW